MKFIESKFIAGGVFNITVFYLGLYMESLSQWLLSLGRFFGRAPAAKAVPALAAAKAESDEDGYGELPKAAE